MSAFLLLGIQSAGAASTLFYVYSGATGTGSGADWNNAFLDLPSNLQRGATYYVAAGSYGGHLFRDAASGGKFVVIQKATQSNHGTDTGWQASFGTGQAVFTGKWTFEAGNYTVDGAFGSGTGTYGIQISTSIQGDTTGVVSIPYGFVDSNISFNHFELFSSGPGTTMNNEFLNGFYTNDFNSPADTNLTIQNCYIHNVYEFVVTSGYDNVLIDHCYFQNAGSTWPDGYMGVNHHGAGMTGDGSGVTLSNNIFENMIGTNNTTYIEPQGSPSNFYIYGNVFWASSPNELTSQWPICLTSSDIINTMLVYNNTFYGLHAATVGVSGGDVTGSTNVQAIDNVWQNIPNVPHISLNNVNVESNNILNTGQVQFANAPAGDFHLLSNTPSGAALTSPYNYDINGTLRGINGNWSIGAYQYAVISSNTIALEGLNAAVVYPNPVVPPYDPVVRVCPGLVDSVDITIFDISGRVVHSGTIGGGSWIIPVEGAGSGQYCYEYKWTGHRASGAYFAVIHAKGSGTTVKAKVKFAVIQ